MPHFPGVIGSYVCGDHFNLRFFYLLFINYLERGPVSVMTTVTGWGQQRRAAGGASWQMPSLTSWQMRGDHWSRVSSWTVRWALRWPGSLLSNSHARMKADQSAEPGMCALSAVTILSRGASHHTSHITYHTLHITQHVHDHCMDGQREHSRPGWLPGCSDH